MAAATTDTPSSGGLDSSASWLRLGIAMTASTIGGVGMWSAVVVLPAVQTEFGASRGDVSLSYTLTMMGFAAGGVLTGKLADRFGITVPMLLAAVALGLGYVLAGLSGSLWQFALAQGILIGAGSSATFGPLLADTSLWFLRRRGIAVALCASGNYIAGTVWPPVVQFFVAGQGWRATHVGIGLFCIATLVPLALLLRRKAPRGTAAQATSEGQRSPAILGLTGGQLQGALYVAGLACCIAMSMPQVHIVAYCGDLGYGVARGAEMLSLMMVCGIVSRIASGVVADRIGGLATLLIGSALQGLALFLYLWFDSLTSLYVISALFGLFQGGLVPSYAIIVREYFPPGEAGTRVGVVLMSTLVGMAAGGWLSGKIFDLAGNYHAAFVHGLAWNLVNVSIVAWLFLRRNGLGRRAAPVPA